MSKDMFVKILKGLFADELSGLVRTEQQKIQTKKLNGARTMARSFAPFAWESFSYCAAAVWLTVRLDPAPATPGHSGNRTYPCGRATSQRTRLQSGYRQSSRPSSPPAACFPRSRACTSARPWRGLPRWRTSTPRQRDPDERHAPPRLGYPADGSDKDRKGSASCAPPSRTAPPR